MLASLDSLLTNGHRLEPTAQAATTAAISGAVRDDAGRAIPVADETAGRGYVHFHHAASNIASTYAILRRPADALTWLRRAADGGWPCYPYFARDPNLDSLRQDPRFVAFLADLRSRWELYRQTL